MRTFRLQLEVEVDCPERTDPDRESYEEQSTLTMADVYAALQCQTREGGYPVLASGRYTGTMRVTEILSIEIKKEP